MFIVRIVFHDPLVYFSNLLKILHPRLRSMCVWFGVSRLCQMLKARPGQVRPRLTTGSEASRSTGWTVQLTRAFERNVNPDDPFLQINGDQSVQKLYLLDTSLSDQPKGCADDKSWSVVVTALSRSMAHHGPKPHT